VDEIGSRTCPVRALIFLVMFDQNQLITFTYVRVYLDVCSGHYLKNKLIGLIAILSSLPVAFDTKYFITIEEKTR
jgi:hypothetical protein